MIRPPVFNEKEVRVNSSGPRQLKRNVIVLCLHLTELSIINRTEYNGLLCLHCSRYLLIMSHPQLAETFFIPSSTCHKIYQVASSVQYWCFHPSLPSSFSLTLLLPGRGKFAPLVTLDLLDPVPLASGG